MSDKLQFVGTLDKLKLIGQLAEGFFIRGG